MAIELIIPILFLVVFVDTKSFILAQQFFTNHFTDQDCKHWTINGVSSHLNHHLFTNCDGQRIFGNFIGNKANPDSISRNWINLRPHYSVTIRAKLYKIDSWRGESLFVIADGITQSIFIWEQNTGIKDICGNQNPDFDSFNTNYNQYIEEIEVNFAHNITQLEIKIGSTLDSSYGSWGIRELNVTLNLCDYSCLSCQNQFSCSTCPISLYLVGAYCECTNSSLKKQKKATCPANFCVTCQNNCQTGYYESSTLNCIECHVACSSCSTAANDNTCTNCSQGFFTNAATGPCYKCYQGCQSCIGLAANECSACSYKYFLHLNQCLLFCPDSYYSEESTQLCQICDSSCLTCDGSTNKHCLSCNNNTYLYDYQCISNCPHPLYGFLSECVETCPINSYIDINLLHCFICPNGCKSCSSAIYCTNCQTNLYLYKNKCITPCPIKHYSAEIGLCILCDSSCLTCQGPSASDCLSCQLSNILIKRICYSTCPNNTYSEQCLNCHINCSSCTGPSENQCLSCPAAKLLHLNSSECVQQCSQGDLVNKDNLTCYKCNQGFVGEFGSCMKCSQTCSTCYASNFLSCTSCKHLTSYLKASTCLSTNGIIYTPNITTDVISNQLIYAFIIIHITLCVIAQIFFTHQTNLILSLQLYQLLSYSYYLSIPLSANTQQILLTFYKFNPTSLLPLISLTGVQNLPTKAILQNKTGYYIIDSLNIHIIMISLILMFIVVKVLQQYAKIIKKLYQYINPLIISYGYRLVVLEQFLTTALFLSFIEINSFLSISSLTLLIFDIVVLFISFYWKTGSQNTKYAIIFDKQIGLSAQKQQALSQLILKIQNNQFVPTFKIFVCKAGIAIIWLLFIHDGSLQIIALLLFSSFNFFITLATPYKRKFIRWTSMFCAMVLILNYGLLFGMYKNLHLESGLQILWFLIIVILLTCTLLQIITNHQYIRQMWRYMAKRGKNICRQ